MESMYRCVAGIDVHKSMLAVVVRQQRDGKVEYGKRKFGTMRSELEHLAACLQKQQFEEVVMESTGAVLASGVVRPGGALPAASMPSLKVQARRRRKWDFRDPQRWQTDGTVAIWKRATFPEASNGDGAG
jgi:hypothetical protein